MSDAQRGYFRSGLPYNRYGSGPRTVVVFLGLDIEHRPLSGFMGTLTGGLYKFLQDGHTVYGVGRRPGMPAGYSMQDMADDYAAMIREEFGGPVDVIGVSTGGSVALYFAAGCPELARTLVIHSSAHRLGDAARKAQMDVARLASRGRWRQACTELLAFTFPGTPFGRLFAWLLSWAVYPRTPESAADLTATVEAEDRHAFKDRLGEIRAPTLVLGGDRDPFYSEKLIRETAAGIPDARLAIYPGMGHPAMGKQFARDVLAFFGEYADRR
jgi:pimeloyl-ACP methyl ester carboxylesterase